MRELLSIRAGELVRIFKADETSLNHFELAIRKTLEKANTQPELDIIVTKASLTEVTCPVEFNSSGKGVLKI